MAHYKIKAEIRINHLMKQTYLPLFSILIYYCNILYLYYIELFALKMEKNKKFFHHYFRKFKNIYVLEAILHS